MHLFLHGRDMTNIMLKVFEIFILKNGSVDFIHLFYKLNVFRLSKTSMKS
jgi:hypothetical protein